MDTNQAYTLLGLEQNASLEQIKFAYRKLAKQYHPDKTGADEFLANMFKNINTAYEFLINQGQNEQFYGNGYSPHNKGTDKTARLDPAIQQWIEDHHKIQKYIDENKRRLDYSQQHNTTKHLSWGSIAKLVGSAALIILFFNPYSSIATKPKTNTNVNTSPKTWSTNAETFLYKSPNIQSTKIMDLPLNQDLDSIGKTNYFIKVKVIKDEASVIGYVLKEKLSK